MQKIILVFSVDIFGLTLFEYLFSVIKIKKTRNKKINWQKLEKKNNIIKISKKQNAKNNPCF